MYKLIDMTLKSGINIKSILRLSDNAHIPLSEDNIDYQEYLKWLAEGNEPLPADE